MCFSETDVNPWLTSQPHGFVHCFLLFLLLLLLSLLPPLLLLFPYIYMFLFQKSKSPECLFFLHFLAEPSVVGWSPSRFADRDCRSVAVAWPSSQPNMLGKEAQEMLCEKGEQMTVSPLLPLYSGHEGWESFLRCPA